MLTYLDHLVGVQAHSPEIAGIDILGPSFYEPLAQGRSKVCVHSLPYEKRSLRFLLRLAKATLYYVVRTRPDIVHVHSSLAGGVVRLCLLVVPNRPKVIYTPHAWSFASGAGRFLLLRRLCEHWLAHLTDQIICVSKDERRLALAAGISASRCTTVISGIPASPLDTPPCRSWQQKRRVFFVGCCDHQKGFDTYLEVMRLLGDRAKGWSRRVPSKQTCADLEYFQRR